MSKREEEKRGLGIEGGNKGRGEREIVKGEKKEKELRIFCEGLGYF